MGEKEKRRQVDATAYMRCHFAPVPKSRGDVTSMKLLSSVIDL